VITLLFILPIISAVFALIPKKNVRDFSLSCFSFIAAIISIYSFHRNFEYSVPLNYGLSLKFISSNLSYIFTAIISILWFINHIYSLGYSYFSKIHNEQRFYCFISLTIFAALGVAFAGNLFTLFIFYELITLFTYPLIIGQETKEAIEAGKTYLKILLLTSSCLFLPAIIYLNNKGIDLYQFSNLSKLSSKETSILLILFLFGVSKTALFPLFNWIKKAMVAPTPVSALLHAVAVVNAGIVTIAKIIFYLFGTEFLITSQINLNIISYPAIITIIIASILAMKEDKLKKILAYSTISNLSYCLLAFSMLNLELGLLHMFIHSFTKIALFFLFGYIYATTGMTRRSEISNFSKIFPISTIAIVLLSLSIVGIPPAYGFFSKFMIITNSLETKNFAVISALIFGSFSTAFYFYRIIHTMYFGEKENIVERKHDKYKVIYMQVAIASAMIIPLIMYLVYND